MKIRQQFPLSEAEAGTPEIGPYDIALARIHAFPNNLVLPYISSGVHPSSAVFSGQYGTTPEGLGSVQPSVIPDYFYYGQIPLTQQPLIQKPIPYEE